MHHKRHLRRPQQGIATISLVVVFLLVMTLITIYANRRAVADLQTLRNQKEYDLAFTQAEVGLATIPAQMGNGMAFLAPCFTGGATECIINNAAPINANYTNTFTVRRCDTQNTCLHVTSNGTWRASAAQAAADATASVTQTFIYRQRLAGQPSAAVMARQLVTTGGSATIVNDNPKTAGLTVHSGGDINLGNATLKSLPGTPPLASVAKNDPTINSLSPTDYFQALFGEPKATVSSDPLTYGMKCGNTVATRVNCNSNGYEPALAGQVGKTIWINEPTVEINSNITIGSPTQPVILIVDGNINLGGNVTIHGLVYATGNVDVSGAGNIKIYGSLITEQTCCGTGNPTVIYSGGMNEAIGVSTGGYIPVPGSWRDF